MPVLAVNSIQVEVEVGVQGWIGAVAEPGFLEIGVSPPGPRPTSWEQGPHRSGRALLPGSRERSALGQPTFQGIGVSRVGGRWVGVVVGPGLADGGSDGTSAQLSTIAAGAVSLVGQDTVRACPGSARPTPRYPDASQDRAELRTVTGLAGRDEHRQWTLALFTGQL